MCGIVAFMNPAEAQPPERRRILIAVTGLSPQIVTETVFALATRQPDPWIPHQIVLITTARAAENARLQLLSEEPGWFHRLRREWSLPAIDFDESSIRVIRRADGSALDDIRDDDDNLRVADGIAAIVRELAAQPYTEIHASIAGGRKTMGYCLGYAMSLFGRGQDRLSHVLVSSPFENHPDFFYPSPRPRIIRSLDRGHDALDASQARIWLGDIPFVRLGDGMPADLLGGTGSFADAVRAAQRRLSPPRLVIHLEDQRVHCGETVIELPPVQVAFMAWFARRRIRGDAPLLKPKTTGAAEAAEFLAEYRRVVPLIQDHGATAKRLSDGMEKAFFEETKSKLKHSLVDALGPVGALPYLIDGQGRPKRYSMALAPDAIRIIDPGMPASRASPFQTGQLG
jgi:CRISPR-associated protein (TIGR02584 family)